MASHQAPDGWSIPLRASLSRRPRLAGCNAVDLGVVFVMWFLFAVAAWKPIAALIGFGLSYGGLLYLQHEDEMGLVIASRAIGMPDEFDA